MGFLRHGIMFFAVLSLISCKNSGEDAGLTTSCSTTQLESDISTILASVSTDVDFSFSVERSDGRRFTYNRGSSTMQTSYESASTSKLVTSVIILRLVQNGYLTLTAKPQDFITSWPLTNAEALYNMTLSQLLSFTSGLTSEPICLNSGIANFETCVNNIANTNSGNGKTPGQEFYYSGTHMQVAGLMAVKARGVANWQSVFSEFKTQTGLFSSGAYDLPSSTNPRLAGGMHWTGEEYMAFLKALKDGNLLNTSSMSLLLADRISTASIGNSPAITSLSEDWHYGYGLWHECQSASFNCTAGTRVSSPGSYGAYPFWDRTNSYFGLVAREGGLATFPNGLAVERAVRSKVESWAACQ
ncbi:serine hydrolase [Bdellovibrio sp. HCB337]|uniref:serine hydrolase n=1 Tax=Bdellovibrio sp. HCB337 TaxID=3394358 RepID=UPI0039A6A1D8